MNTRNVIFATMVIFIITLEILIALDYVSQQEQFKEKRTGIYDSVIELQNQIGYVGLIHNFKNYILRPDEPIYRSLALENYQAALLQLNILEQQGQSVLGQLNMNVTRDMLETYKGALDRLPDLLEENIPTREIDALVRYDDLPSHSEIELTSKKLLSTLDNQISLVLHRSLTYALLALLALIFSLIAISRFFFNQQKKVIEANLKLSDEMEKQKNELLRSQQAMLNVISDINQEKKRTGMLNTQLSKKNDEMEQFIYSVSHDLKSPLVTIGGFSKQLIKELAEDITEKQAHRLQRISENVDQMELLLGDLLELSRISQQAIEKEHLDIESIVNKQCKSLEGLINETDTTITTHKPLNTIYANERLLSQCVLNLIGNAIHYRDSNRSPVIDISTQQNQSHTILAIKDNGMGIDAKYHQLVFQIFERLATGKGTGVGLTIVKTVMDKHNGDVTLESQLGNGSCFLLHFPHEQRVEASA